jgi:hypothetical protein
MATLKNPKDLYSLKTLPEMLEKRIREIPDQYPRIKLLIQAMLTIDESTRPNFSSLSGMLQSIKSQQNAAQCDECGLEKNITELKSKYNDYMCIECISRVNFIPECQM